MKTEDIINFLKPIGLKFLTAILVLIVGLFIIKLIKRIIENKLTKQKTDNTLKPFLLSTIVFMLKLILVIIIVGILGIDTSSLVAVVASLGFAIGLAFQGSLSNFAGGILLIIFKPFKLDDYIEANGIEGTVSSLKILYTELITVDNKVIFIPNGNLSNSNIVNYTAKKTRMLDLSFSAHLIEEPEKVKKVLLKVVNKHKSILKEKEPLVRMLSHDASAIVYRVRVWVKTEEYWNVYYDLMENVKTEFTKENILIPYNQLDVKIKK